MDNLLTFKVRHIVASTYSFYNCRLVINGGVEGMFHTREPQTIDGVREWVRKQLETVPATDGTWSIEIDTPEVKSSQTQLPRETAFDKTINF